MFGKHQGLYFLVSSVGVGCGLAFPHYYESAMALLFFNMAVFLVWYFLKARNRYMDEDLRRLLRMAHSKYIEEHETSAHHVTHTDSLLSNPLFVSWLRQCAAGDSQFAKDARTIVDRRKTIRHDLGRSLLRIFAVGVVGSLVVLISAIVRL